MLKHFPVLILSCVLFVHLIETTSGNYCDSNSLVNQAFNLGTNVYLGQTSRSIWKFDPDVRRTINRKLDLETIFGKNSFNWIDTAFTFVFNECDHNTKTVSYCEVTNRAKGLVIGIGRRKEAPNDSRKYGYIAYRVSSGHDLIQINETIDNIPWDLKGTGLLSESFWVEMSGDLYYESSVFVKSRNELIVSVFDTSTFSDSSYHLMSRKLQDDGQWSKWTELAKTGFRGMLEIEKRVFGFDKKNTAFEFKWSDDNTILFEPISDLKQLLNCFKNSSLWEHMESFNEDLDMDKEFIVPGIDDIISDSFSTSTTTTTTTPTPNTSTESTISSTNDESVYVKEEENEIQVKTETINYETIRPEAVLLTNITESSTLSEPQMNQKLEEMPESRADDSADWSAVFVVAILLLIIVIVIALIIIVRNKSKSRIVYLNSKSDDSKSAEIPLNNNDKILHPKDV